ncbi:hypothetical protein ACERII_22840 [Evansella sp. AB-rgal1]|uniref:hypothetical protein n=1 Tax=Evansella sp. AB-rgal1 TaxID=3242696 RepID=UPI00359D9F95
MKNNILNSFIGVVDDRDEYQRHEIYKELAYSGIVLWHLTMLLMFVSLIIDTIQKTSSFATLALFIINMIYAIMTIIKLGKKNLDETDCASIEEYEEKKKQLKKMSIIGGFQWGLFMIFLLEYVLPYLRNGVLDVSWFNVVVWSIGGMFFGLITYWFSRSKLKKYY